MSNLIEQVGATAAGTSTFVPVESPENVDILRRWCDRTGNEILAVFPDGVEIHRGRTADPVAALPESIRPGYRLWIYTNFHCNLACDYCCVSSSPRAERRVMAIGEFTELVNCATVAGVRELYVTGGEPFLLADLGERLAVAAAHLPTTVLTNGMLWSKERLRRLDALTRQNLALQISLDSATSGPHDHQRGDGSHSRALAGIRLALELGFRVRVAATVEGGNAQQEEELGSLFDELGLGPDERVIRRIARQGMANTGLVLSRASLIPEICVTTEGVWWHPVGATDPAMKVADNWKPFDANLEAVRTEFRGYRLRGDILASTFPCA